MNVFQNISLKEYNSFGIDAKARYFIEIFSVEELTKVLEKYPTILPLGGGSNLLLTKDVEIPVVKISLKGISFEENENQVLVTAQAGENWHQFVQFCIEKEWGGVENLSLIPGNVGAAPVQNIGAYGVELKDVFHSCEVFDISAKCVRIFTKEECKFAYRESIFKTEGKGKYIILSVTLLLTKENHRENIDYGAIRNQLKINNIEGKPSLSDISKAVCEIRNSKLPNPRELGNSGSFFKNAIVKKEDFLKIQEKYPDMPYYTISEKEIKIPTAWLIETCHLKGYRQGDAGVHSGQPLVLVNYGTATGRDIFALSEYIKKVIWDTFQIALETEVNII